MVNYPIRYTSIQEYKKDKLNYPDDFPEFKKRLIHDYPDLGNKNLIYIYKNPKKGNKIFIDADTLIQKLLDSSKSRQNFYSNLPFNYLMVNTENWTQEERKKVLELLYDKEPDVVGWDHEEKITSVGTFVSAGIKLFDSTSLHSDEPFKVNNYFNMKGDERYYVPPKGGISKEDETIWNAAIREFFEETNGVTITLLESSLNYGIVGNYVKISSTEFDLPFYGIITKLENQENRGNKFTRFYHIKLLENEILDKLKYKLKIDSPTIIRLIDQDRNTVEEFKRILVNRLWDTPPVTDIYTKGNNEISGFK